MADVDIDTAARRTAELEGAAEAVEHAKHFVVDIDRRLHMDREGLRAIKKSDEHPLSSSWVLCPGGVFLQAPKASIAQFLKSEMNELTARQQLAQAELKARVVELAHLEGLDTTLDRLKGFNLRGS
ncbi:Hypothetical protein, putative [Bodo saltans]|uniref:P53 and DNA damage-regulated protein 1 n=1 Tax=Bodo saltans TaxID=75058 RepID=A0A0S4JTC5_BODSA|nr:Hypothetical protein, putative [Bodo saltans]|eukprot:CUG94071.1 Hypothetical protein, putative [Bodo saltans]